MKIIWNYFMEESMHVYKVFELITLFLWTNYWRFLNLWGKKIDKTKLANWLPWLFTIQLPKQYGFVNFKVRLIFIWIIMCD